MRLLARCSCLMIVLAIATIGCDLVRAPIVEPTGVRLRSMGLSGATVMAQLRIENPNRFAIESDSVSFAFEASDARHRGTWTPVTSGTNTQRVRVAAGDTTTLDIPIEFAYAALGVPIRSLLERGTFNYRINGVVFVRKPLRRRVPFSDEGNVSITAPRNRE